ncbi:unnamed protein product [Protopolystoma xenopodis]|uniref:Uncharacterized protein n=1 Tax=Protopolystoma xenopodis TaxID=117903 RepID=A0A3S5A5K4_9PLAT|nr:unnamed protein product [Protopolystoma xenopodis]
MGRIGRLCGAMADVQWYQVTRMTQLRVPVGREVARNLRWAPSGLLVSTQTDLVDRYFWRQPHLGTRRSLVTELPTTTPSRQPRGLSLQLECTGRPVDRHYNEGTLLPDNDRSLRVQMPMHPPGVIRSVSASNYRPSIRCEDRQTRCSPDSSCLLQPRPALPHLDTCQVCGCRRGGAATGQIGRAHLHPAPSDRPKGPRRVTEPRCGHEVDSSRRVLAWRGRARRFETGREDDPGL